MGGFRCIFRNCPVSSGRFPKMHFFKLPVREPERMLAWLKYCDKIEILKLRPEQQANRAVCARHFRYECFMNYKLDRLVANQTPTLIRISKELAWDVEHLDENGEATLLKMTTPEFPHLIPPKDFECPLGFHSGDENQNLDYHISSKHKEHRISVDMQTNDNIVRKRTTPMRYEADAKKPKLHLARNNQEKTNVDHIIKVEIPVNSKADKTLNVQSVESQTELDDPLQSSLKELQLKHDILTKDFETLAKKYALLTKSNAELENKCLELTQKRASTSTNTLQLTKMQIFNGVKKYLGSTMTVLVRMEMFGGAERAWKNDEREFAAELLKLGEDFYKHCIDEWRFRLPALSDARNWLVNIDENTEDQET